MFAALVDVAEMSLAKTDDRLAEQFLALGGRPDLAERVLEELAAPGEKCCGCSTRTRCSNGNPTCTRQFGYVGRSSTCSAT